MNTVLVAEKSASIIIRSEEVASVQIIAKIFDKTKTANLKGKRSFDFIRFPSAWDQ